MWLGLTWLPLIQGAWFAGWGTFFASPPLQNRRQAANRGTQGGKKLTAFFSSIWHQLEHLRASMLNSIIAIVPVAHMVIIITLSALAEAQWSVSIPYVSHRFDTH